MPKGSDQLHIKESYTYTREVSGPNAERLVELIQEARLALCKGVSTERLTVVLDQALQEAAGRRDARVLVQSPAPTLGDVRSAEASTGDHVRAHAPLSAVVAPDRSESPGTDATQGAMGEAAELSSPAQQADGGPA